MSPPSPFLQSVHILIFSIICQLIANHCSSCFSTKIPMTY
jgi:hypothetical protein